MPAFKRLKHNSGEKLTPEQKAWMLNGLKKATHDQIMELAFIWELMGRTEQQEPEGDWTTWLLIGGRGSGKTRAGAEWVRKLATGNRPVSPIALVGETMAEARAIMVEGPSGILAVHPQDEKPKFEMGRGVVIWPNGVKAMLMPANDPDRFRGPQFAAAWSDELAKWPKAEAAWDMLQFEALRIADRIERVAVMGAIAPSETVLTHRRHVRTETAVDLATGRARAAVELRLYSEPAET